MRYPVSYCLVLSGGGAKGSYQVGAMKALKELGIKIDAVVGTSVGALNGALWVLNKLTEAEKLWRRMQLSDIVRIPPELLKDGKFHLTHSNIPVLNSLTRRITKKGGMSTEPLRNIMKGLLDEKAMRHSGIDFGVVSYQLGGFKALEKFMEQIPEGKLEDHLMGSAAFPGFEIQRIDGHMVLDGGLTDNIPFSLASRRGYKNIIVVDVSGLGVNRRPQWEHHDIVYIKNSRDTGGVMDFDLEQADINIRMGYLDTLKVFGKVQGVDIFLKPDKKIEKKIYDTLFKPEVIEKYRQYLQPNPKEKPLDSRIRKILPQKVRSHKSLPLALLECTVTSLNLDKTPYYTWEALLGLILGDYSKIRNRESSYTQQRGFFSKFSAVIAETRHIFNLNPVHYNQLMDFVFGNTEINPLHTRTLSRFIPELVGAKIFITVLEHMKK